MTNMLTLALVVLLCAIVVMFSNEFGNLLKKIFAIRGMKLFLPLILVTSLLVTYESWVYWFLVCLQHFLLSASESLTRYLPFPAFACSLVNLLLLLVLSLLPVFAISAWIKRKSYESFQYPYLTSTILWLIVATLLTLSYPYY